MKLGIDLDGVLCDFVHGYNALVKQELGLDLPYPAPSWNWHLEGGVTEEQANRLWDIIKATPFQGTLRPLSGAVENLERLNDLSLQGHDIYFITNRSGSLAKLWSDMWLKFHGMDTPTVLVTADKSPVVKGLKLNVYVDDRPENNQEVIEQLAVNAVDGVRVYLVDHPYNRWAEAEGVYGIRVANLAEVLEREFPAERKAA